MFIPNDCSRSSGVYMIVNRVTRKRYVGSTVNPLVNRAKAHRDCLAGNRHPNIHLQRSYQKYGPKAFLFVVLEECPPEDCLTKEQEWMDTLDVYRTGYNRTPTAGSRLGAVLSEETKRKIGEANRGKKASEATKAKMREARKDQKWSQKTRETMEKRHWSKGPRAAEIAAKIAAANLGRIDGEERKRKASETQKANWAAKRAAKVTSPESTNPLEG